VRKSLEMGIYCTYQFIALSYWANSRS